MSDQTKNRFGVPFFLDFFLSNDTVYLFFLRLCYRNVNNTLFCAFKPVIILAIPYFTDFFSDGDIVPSLLSRIVLIQKALLAF